MASMSKLRLIPALSLLALLSACGTAPQTGGKPATAPGSSGPRSLNLPGSGEIENPALVRFKGMAARDVTAKLGDPSFRRRDPPAEIWQYYGPGCVLDLFLYDEKGAKAVSYAELRGRDPGVAADGGCLSQLLDGKRSPGS